MRLGRRIAAHSGLDIAPRVLIWNFVEHFAKRPMRPWVLAVDRDMALIIIRVRIERCAGLVKLAQRAKGRQAEDRCLKRLGRHGGLGLSPARLAFGKDNRLSIQVALRAK